MHKRRNAWLWKERLGKSPTLISFAIFYFLVDVRTPCCPQQWHGFWTGHCKPRGGAPARGYSLPNLSGLSLGPCRDRRTDTAVCVALMVPASRSHTLRITQRAKCMFVNLKQTKWFYIPTSQASLLPGNQTYWINCIWQTILPNLF